MTMGIQEVLLFLFLHIHVLNIVAQLPDLRYGSCGGNGNYTENSTYKNNLNTLLTSLPSKIDNYGFYYDSIGQNTDEVSGIVLCRGDVELDDCRSCVNNTAQKLVQLCPTQREATGGYDECSLQYSNDSSILETQLLYVQYFLWNTANASKPEEFSQELGKLLENLRDRAVNGGPYRKYASDYVTGPDDQTIYALVQCTPDLSPQNCFKCLTDAYGTMPQCPCLGKRGGRIIGSRCNFRYESSRFFVDVPLEAPPPAGNDDKTAPVGNGNETAPTGNDKTAPMGNGNETAPTGNDNTAPMGNGNETAPTGNDNTAPIVQDDKKARLVIIIIVPTVIVVILTVCIFVILMKKRKRKPVGKIQG